jgi:hypothetical protein
LAATTTASPGHRMVITTESSTARQR